MTLYFNKRQKERILSGKMIKTCRAWKNAQVQVGQIKKAKTNRISPPFAILRIKGISEEELGNVNPREVGFESQEDFRETWLDCYPLWDNRQEVWVVRFKVIEDKEENGK